MQKTLKLAVFRVLILDYLKCMQDSGKMGLYAAGIGNNLIYHTKLAVQPAKWICGLTLLHVSADLRDVGKASLHIAPVSRATTQDRCG
jgi:hypothetical protein